jgi:hypothetical protein
MAETSSEVSRPPEGTWAQPAGRLHLEGVPASAINLNVDGKRIAGALQGFGPLWQKTYRIRLAGARVTPAEVIRVWRENFPRFWPKGNRFYAPLTCIEPGEIALLNLEMPGGLLLSTGVMVIYADDESFSFMTPEGHMFAGWITFSAFQVDGETTVQVHVLIRASDPLYELGFRLGGTRYEDHFWQQTLRSLGAFFGVDGPVLTEVTCLDPRVQWGFAGNLRHNAALRTALYTACAPVRWLRLRRQHG